MFLGVLVLNSGHFGLTEVEQVEMGLYLRVPFDLLYSTSAYWEVTVGRERCRVVAMRARMRNYRVGNRECGLDRGVCSTSMKSTESRGSVRSVKV